MSQLTTARARVGSVSNKHNPSAKLGLYVCISSRITIGIQNWMTVKETITVLMSHSQFSDNNADTETCMA